MPTVTPETRYTVTETRTRDVTLSLAELTDVTGVALPRILEAAAADRLTRTLHELADITYVFESVVDTDYEYTVDPITSTTRYTVADPADENGTMMPLAEGTLRELDDLLMPGAYIAHRVDGDGTPRPLVVG